MTGSPSVVVVGQVARDLVLVIDEVPGLSSSVDVHRRPALDASTVEEWADRVGAER